MECDIEDALDRRLKYVNDWLQFAEKKNATLLVLNAGAIWGVSRLLNVADSPKVLTHGLLWLGLIAVGLSGVLCMISILPNLQIGVLKKTEDVNENDNSFFFGDIAKYSVDEYLELLKSCYELKNKPFLKSHRDYVEQLIANSRIANQKFRIFTFSSHLTLYGFISLLIFYVAVVLST